MNGKSAVELEKLAAAELAGALRLPAASGTPANLIRLIVDAATARVREDAQADRISRKTLSVPRR